MRGGVGQFPISTSNGYFSKHYIVNDASVNSVWNFGEQWVRYNKSELGTYLAGVDTLAARRAANRLVAVDETERMQVLKTDSVNVVFVVLESWSAQLVGALGGMGAPNFSLAAAEGILFEKIYSASWTSHKGNASLFSGYPALPGSPIHKFDDKIRELASIPKALSRHESRYYYGGDLDFGHISGYLMNAGFDQLFDEEQLGALQPRGSLGAHDEATLALLLQDMEKAKSAFFYTLFTLSTHSPYDFPGNESSGGAHEWTNYARSIEYADRQLGEFLQAARQSKVFDNTLFVFVADHGRTNDYNKLPYNDKMYHIPMLWWGGAIREEFKGTNVSKVGSQSDVAKTLLVQLNEPTEDFRFSKDLFNPTSASFAFFEHHYGYGWITDDGYFSYDMKRDVIIDNSFKEPGRLESAIQDCKMYLSTVYRDFMF